MSPFYNGVGLGFVALLNLLIGGYVLRTELFRRGQSRIRPHGTGRGDLDAYRVPKPP